jgi:hypothetical protein
VEEGTPIVIHHFPAAMIHGTLVGQCQILLMWSLSPHPHTLFSNKKVRKLISFVTSSLACSEDIVCGTSYEGVFPSSPALLPSADMVENVFIFVSILLLTCHYLRGYKW